MRLAVVLESIDSADLRAGTLYLRSEDSSPTSVALSNTLRYAKSFCKKAGGGSPSYALAVINWNAAKTYHLDDKATRSFHANFTARVTSILDSLDPTHVLIVGDLAGRNLLPDVKHLEHKRGWVFIRDKRKWCVTLNVEELVSDKSKTEDEDEEFDADSSYSSADKDKYKKADLLFYVARNAANLLAGRHLFSVQVNPNPVYVNTIERFDKLYKALCDPKNQLIALDSETRTLESYDNNIYFIQFAFSANKGFVVPIEHPKSPFTAKEQRYIKKRLRAFFWEKDPAKLKTIVVLNGAFDFRVLRAQLKIPVIHHRVHEITAGEALIDENLGVFSRVSLRTGKLESRENLRAILTSYGEDWYFNAPFSKEERNTTGLQEPDDPNVLNYCSMDVQSLHAIAEQQHRMAGVLSTYDYASEEKVPFTRFFEKHLLHQMGDTALAISTLEQHGSYIDMPYMLQLLGEKSPLKEALANTLSRFKQLPNVIKANALIARKEGSGSARTLFGKDPFVLSLTKPTHKIAMFIEVLGLKPLEYTKTKLPKIDKKFNATYARKYPEVALYSEFQMLTKLLSTYVRGWVDKLHKSLDSRRDGRFRARYTFFRIVSGRLGSFDPNHQQIPSRGEKAKIIKRIFIAPPNHLQIRADYSAHEVRFWAILARDKVLAGAFKVALKLKRALVVVNSPGIKPLSDEENRALELEIETLRKELGAKPDYRDSVRTLESSDPSLSR